MIVAGALYLLIGFVLGYFILPVSWPFGRNAIFLTLLWPWPLAGNIVYRVTGKWPRWAPWL